MYMLHFNKILSLSEARDAYYEHLNIVNTNRRNEDEFEFVTYLLDQVKMNQFYIESLVEAALKNWKIERVGIIEKNILRISVAEFLDSNNKVPYKVTINEAIEIARKFCSRDSGSFVNGVINRVADILNIKDYKI
ncbi:transcription antitermination factor NusB [bacterium]|nr:transcription antitermination factor NusB [bacterium]